MIGSLRVRAALTVLLLMASFLLPGCAARRADSTPQPRIVLTLLDLSGSTGAVRAQYLSQVERIVAQVPPGARLVVLPVSSRSLTAPAALDITFPSYTWWSDNSFTHGRAMSRLQKEAMASVAALLEQHPDSRGTALLDSLLQVQEFLKGYPEGTGEIYIISDMVEQDEYLDLYDLQEDGVAAALARVAEGGRLPSLRGAAVTVAGLEAAGHLPTSRVLAIRAFWEQLFESAGARLLWYSPTLQLPERL